MIHYDPTLVQDQLYLLAEGTLLLEIGYTDLNYLQDHFHLGSGGAASFFWLIVSFMGALHFQFIILWVVAHYKIFFYFFFIFPFIWTIGLLVKTVWVKTVCTVSFDVAARPE